MLLQSVEAAQSLNVLVGDIVLRQMMIAVGMKLLSRQLL